MIKLINVIFISSISLITKSQDFCGFVESVQKYQDSVKLKHNGDYDVLDANTFDINSYLDSYDNIEIANGYKIGVYYFDNFLDGNPYLYALENKENLNNKNRNALYTFLNEPKNRAKNHIVPKDSKLGFLQYLFFSVMGEQFALKWHSNYAEKRIICSIDKLNSIINDLVRSDMFSTDSIGLMNLHEVNPLITIEHDEKYCNISWLENRTHYGIFRCTYQIKRYKPYTIKKVSEIRLLEIKMNFIY